MRGARGLLLSVMTSLWFLKVTLSFLRSFLFLLEQRKVRETERETRAEAQARST